MIFFFYLTRLFWSRWISVTGVSLCVVLVFEHLTLSGHYMDILLKIPFHIHTLLPFITFISMTLFTWTLMTHQEWVALSSIGRSPWQILRAPMVSIAILGVLDVWGVVPISQNFFNPFETTKIGISLNSSGWKKSATQKGYVFFNATGPQHHVLEFDHNSVLVRHLYARSVDFRGDHLVCRDAWSLQAHHTPKQIKSATIALSHPLPLEEKEFHPITLSLGQVYSALKANPKGSILLSARMHYWWSHFFWFLSLVFLAPALFIGSSSRQAKVFSAICGFLALITLYLMKEWIYALSIPLAHSWPVFLLWIPFFITIALTWGLFFKKREL